LRGARPDVDATDRRSFRKEASALNRLRALPLWKRLAIDLSAFVLVGYTAISVVLPTVATRCSALPADADPAAIGAIHQDIAFRSREGGLELSGWLFRSPTGTGRSAILVHGWQANRMDPAMGAPALGMSLLAHGYDLLMFDLRSCGRSQGWEITFGTKERFDVLGAYDFMTQRGYAPSEMLVLGDSLGAASVLEASAQMPDAGALVADSSFEDLRRETDYRMASTAHIPAWMGWGPNVVGQLAFGIDPNLRPIDVVRAEPKRAFLFFHGLDDNFIPPQNSKDLFSASSNPQSRLVLLPGVGHVQGFRSYPDLYLKTLFAFADLQLRHG
jgi:pimeloyl-ACP methyl ester carboxylesterase